MRKQTKDVLIRFTPEEFEKLKSHLVEHVRQTGQLSSMTEFIKSTLKVQE